MKTLTCPFNACASRQVSNRQHGFTLIEVLATLAIMALIAASLVPSVMRRNPGVELMSAARTLGSDLRLARENAIERNTDFWVEFNVDDNSYSAPGLGIQEKLPGEIALALVLAASEQTGSQAGRIRFRSDGSATGGRVRLVQDGYEVSVLVDWLTGKVEVSETPSE